MAQAAKRIPEFEQAAPKPWTDMLVGDDAVTWNPVRQMHARPRSEFAGDASLEPGMGLRGRVAVIVGSSALLWTAAIYAGWLLLG